MGSRLLADWVANPLTDAAAIRARHEAVGELVADAALADDLREALRRVYDVERLLARVDHWSGEPARSRLSRPHAANLARLEGQADGPQESTAKSIGRRRSISASICAASSDAALADECPLAAARAVSFAMVFIRRLDALRELAHGGKQWIARYQAQESQRTGIPTLKVGFNKVFGYYLEITNAHRQRIPDEYIRKQTVKNAERYITPELKEYEEKV